MPAKLETKRCWCIFRRWVTVEPLLFLCVFTSFVSYPTSIQLVYDRVCSTTPNCTHPSPSNESTVHKPSQGEQEVQTVSSHILLYSNLALGIPSAVISFAFGHLSDSHGRKTFILFSLLMSVMSKYLFVIIVYWPLDVYFVVLSNFLDGCGGSFPVLNLLVYSYIADVSTLKQRTWRIGVLEANFYFAAMLGGLLSGVIIQNAGYGVVYLLAMACQVTAAVYVALVLRESVISRQKGDPHNQMTKKSHFKELLSSVQRAVQSRPRIVVLCVSFLVIFFATQMIFLGLNDIDYLFALGAPLSWDHETLGFFAAYLLGMNGLSNMIVLPLLSCCKVSDYVIACMGLLSGIALLVGVGVSTQTWHMFVAATLGSLRGLYTTTLRSLLSKIASKQHEGVMFAVLSVLQTAATILASVLYNSVYPPTREVWPGLSFIIMAVTLVPPLIAMFAIWICHHRNYSGRCSRNMNNVNVPPTDVVSH